MHTHTAQMWRVTCEAPRGSTCATSALAKLQLQPVEHCEKLQFVLYTWRLVLATGGSQEVLILQVLALSYNHTTDVRSRVRLCTVVVAPAHISRQTRCGNCTVLHVMQD
jgi:hypothetical protein